MIKLKIKFNHTIMVATAFSAMLNTGMVVAREYMHGEVDAYIFESATVVEIPIVSSTSPLSTEPSKTAIPTSPSNARLTAFVSPLENKVISAKNVAIVGKLTNAEGVYCIKPATAANITNARLAVPVLSTAWDKSAASVKVPHAIFVSAAVSGCPTNSLAVITMDAYYGQRSPGVAFSIVVP
ncbi:hypothetical protein CCP3SC5AM1_120008 [Gammaproteobacteria bacterium]